MSLLRRDSVTGTPIVPKNLICSRLRTEFEEIEFLGKGAFGDVVKVCNGYMCVRAYEDYGLSTGDTIML